MAWTAAQAQRLSWEINIVGNYFPTMRWYNAPDPARAYVEGVLRTNSGRDYSLRVYVPPTFPSTCPDMVVASPAPLRDRKGRKMDEASASMHTLGTRDGCTKICHYRPNLWVPQNTVYLVLLKGRIWLEAYESHLRSGRDLDAYLPHM
ncbi:hypothetical protein Cs7R123_49170 [Catellatospora sp. TT07R-123]|uniref:hypothetical protein n=1 Tax=Catellatospora sp. TT07R-123 TaxID=2733863 RepID=UPI001B006A17|nr:hypothetical protein [Catellatospora sp. TT07R-123]GHJ47575.1 hypothetical protein Cs7R123_49170 [Catellatospora sp. TT07R-123]